ncbi:MAG TPA: DinB family protein [Flavobacterium sp.]|nr:DinB family protein [Flavobacterium sp.]
MKLVLHKMNFLLSSAKAYFEKADRLLLEAKPMPDKWSKKEILGHLIDSAINNIQRFTEIQTSHKPYQIKSYNPDELVLANNYQNKDIDELFQLWFHLNEHIKFLIANQNTATLTYSLILPNTEVRDLKFLIDDYADHLEHHLDQIYRE